MSSATNVYLGGPGTSGTLDLAGNTISLASLSVAASANAAAQVVGNSSTNSNATLVLSSRTSFGGTIQDVLRSGSQQTGVTVTAGNVVLNGSNSYSGPTNVNGGVLSINEVQTGSGNYNVSSSAALLINGLQSGGGTITVSPGGILGGAGSIASPISLASGANLVAGGLSGSAGTLSLSALALNGGGTTQFGLTANPSAGNGLINVSGLLSLTGTTTINVVNLGGGLASGTYSYPLFTYGSLSGTPSSAFALASTATNSRQSVSFTSTSNTNGEILLNISANPHTLVWTGAVNGTWDATSDGQNWQNSQSSADYFANGDNVTFDDSTGGTTVRVSIAGSVSPGSVAVNTNLYGVVLTGTGSVGGQMGLLKTGAASLTLSNTNNYSGNTSIQAGTLVVGTNNALSTASTVVFGASQNSGTLDLAGNSQQVAGLATSPNATAANQIIGNSSTVSDSTLCFAATSPSTFGGTMQDSVNGGTHRVNLDVVSGQLTLTGSNTYTGATTINGGTLQLGCSSAVPSGALAPNVSISGVLDLNGNGLVLPSISGTGTVVISLALRFNCNHHAWRWRYKLHVRGRIARWNCRHIAYQNRFRDINADRFKLQFRRNDRQRRHIADWQRWPDRKHYCQCRRQCRARF